jgi:hypothetical protein
MTSINVAHQVPHVDNDNSMDMSLFGQDLGKPMSSLAAYTHCTIYKGSVRDRQVPVVCLRGQQLNWSDDYFHSGTTLRGKSRGFFLAVHSHLDTHHFDQSMDNVATTIENPIITESLAAAVPRRGDINRRQMSEVRDHCDWTISKLNDDLTGNVIETLSLGTTRLTAYRKMKGGKVDGLVRHVPLSHGSFNLLFKQGKKIFPDTIASVTTVRIKHRVNLFYGHATTLEHSMVQPHQPPMLLFPRKMNFILLAIQEYTQQEDIMVPPLNHTPAGNRATEICTTGT